MEAFVVGGGIAGLAAATALLRTGWRVTVAERQPVLGEIGAGLALSRNGLRALTWLGLADESREAGAPCAFPRQQDHGVHSLLFASPSVYRRHHAVAS